MKKICTISFSGRPGGNCGSIAGERQKYWQGRGAVKTFDFSALEITPCGRCEYECFGGQKGCPHFSDPEFAICEAITDSDITYFVVPNYCDYPPANFFIFNERGQCYFQRHHELLEKYLAVRKKFIVVSNTGRENFTAAFRYHVPEGTEPEALFLAARKFGRISIKGDLMASPEARETLRRFL